MSNIIDFPVKPQQNRSDLEILIDKALKAVPQKNRAKLKFELIKTIDSYESVFSKWILTLPDDTDEELVKQFYAIAQKEHENKVKMLADIIMLKIEKFLKKP